MALPEGQRDIDALKLLIEAAHQLVADLAHGPTRRAIDALATIAPDQREVIVTALERAAVTWTQSEAFTHVHNIRLRANPNAQLFVRVVDRVEEPTADEFDLLPEALRAMRRLGVSMHPDLRAVWEPAVVAARDMLTPQERMDCINFLRQALALVSEGADVEQAPAEVQARKKSGSTDD
jgi:hypothetical protein